MRKTKSPTHFTGQNRASCGPCEGPKYGVTLQYHQECEKNDIWFKAKINLSGPLTWPGKILYIGHVRVENIVITKKTSGVPKQILISNFRVTCGLGTKVASLAHLPGQQSDAPTDGHVPDIKTTK